MHGKVHEVHYSKIKRLSQKEGLSSEKMTELNEENENEAVKQEESEKMKGTKSKPKKM